MYNTNKQYLYCTVFQLYIKYIFPVAKYKVQRNVKIAIFSRTLFEGFMWEVHFLLVK